MKKLLVLFLFLFLCSLTKAAEVPTPAILNDKFDVKGLVWNKWDTDNFIILSLDKPQGYKLFKNIEEVKKQSLEKWGFVDSVVENDCKIVCVSNDDLLKKLFRLEKTHSEVIKDGSGNFSSSIWTTNDADISAEVLYVILLQDNNLKWWVKRGIYNLTKNEIKDIKSNIPETSDNLSKIVAVTENDWKNKPELEKNNFDENASLLCLFLRKEFGQNNFVKILKSKQTEKEIAEVLGFKNSEDAEKVFKRYAQAIYKDKMENKIPDNYLKIQGVK